LVLEPVVAARDRLLIPAEPDAQPVPSEASEQHHSDEEQPANAGAVFRNAGVRVPAKIVSDSSDIDLTQHFNLTPEESFAALRGVKISALQNERALGKGPEFKRVGRRIFYPLKEIEKYLAACTVKPTRTATLIDGVARRRKSSAKA
jgi:hypothetical protein